MAAKSILFLLFCLTSGIINCRAQFTFPETLVEPLSPTGLRVSIPDVEGIRVFSFHGKVNEPIVEGEPGTWNENISVSVDGRWTFYSDVSLQNEDKIYYWMSIDHFDGENIQTYTKIGDEFVVKLSELTSQSPVAFEPQDSNTSQTNEKSEKLGAGSESCVKSLTKIETSVSPCEGQIIFEDTFDSPKLDETKWTPEVRIADQPDYPFVVYMKGRENLFIQDSAIVIKPQVLEERFDSVRGSIDLGEKCTAPVDSDLCSATAVGGIILPPIISAKITTKKSFSFTYGRIEVVAKLPLGDWIYPEIQLDPKDNTYGVKDYGSGIMRIALVKGNLDQVQNLDAGVITETNAAYRSLGTRSKTGPYNWNEDFHNYTMVWQPDKIFVLVDGEEFGSIIPEQNGFSIPNRETPNKSEARWSKGTILAPFDQPFHITLGVAAGGNEFANGENKPWANESPKAKIDFWKARTSWYPTWSDRSTMQVKSVRVYAL